MTFELFCLAVVVLAAMFVVLGTILGKRNSGTAPEAPAKSPAPRWRDFRIRPEKFLAGERPAIEEQQAGGLQLYPVERTRRWVPHLKLQDASHVQRLRFKPVLFSGGRALHVFMGREELFQLRIDGTGVRFDPPAQGARRKKPERLELSGNPEEPSWELRRNDQTIALAFRPPPAEPIPAHALPRSAEYSVQVLHEEDPLPALAVVTGLEILKNARN